MKFLSTLASTLIYSSLGLLIIPSQARAELCGDTSNLTDAQFATNFPDACTKSPSTYKVTLYEFGLCTSNPIVAGGLERTNCSQTFDSPNGQLVDLAGKRQVTLNPAHAKRPAANTYTYSYAIASNNLILKGELQTATNTWRSDGSTYIDTDTTNASRTISNSVEFRETINTFDDDACLLKSSKSFSSGRFDATIVNNSLKKADSCVGAAKIIVSFKPNSPYIITDKTTGVNVDFIVDETGMAVISETDPPTFGVRSFSAGPVRVKIKTIN